MIRIKKSDLRDCLMYQSFDGQDGTISIECGFGCSTCGFNRDINAIRKHRIRHGDFSRDEERGVAYLKLHDGV